MNQLLVRGEEVRQMTTHIRCSVCDKINKKGDSRTVGMSPSACTMSYEIFIKVRSVKG